MGNLIFERALPCQDCGGRAEGKLLDRGYASIGLFCERCARRRILKEAKDTNNG